MPITVSASRILVSLVSLVAVLAACAPAAPLSPTVAPAKPAATTAAAATAIPASKPAEAAKPAAPIAAAPTTAPAAKPATKPELSTIRLGELKVAAKIPTYLADKLGYFKEEGLSIEYTFVDSGVMGLPILTAGKLDITHGPFAAVLSAVNEGADYVFLTSTDSATSKVPDPFALLVATSSPIQKVEDLAGKTIATSALNSPTWVYGNALLKKHGVDPKSVKWVEVPLPNQADALGQGRVDAVTLIEPFHHVLLASGKGRAISYPYVEVTPGIDLGAWAVTRQWLNKNPNTARSYVRAYNRAKQYASTHDKETRDAVIEWTKTDPELARGMLLSNWKTDVDVNSLQAFADLLLDQGVLKKKVDFKSLMHDTYLNPPI